MNTKITRSLTGRPLRRWAFLALALVALPFHPASLNAQTNSARDERHGESGGEGPAHLVLTYKCPPANRAAFRAFMETQGVAQFEQWKRSGGVKNYLILFSSFVNEQLADMWVVLDFEKFVDIAKWQEIERQFPGGLSPAGLALATPRTCVYTDMNWADGQSGHDISKSVFMIIPYSSLTDVGIYFDFIDKYVMPQLKGWRESGILLSYGLYTDQNPPTAPWHTVFVYEYAGMKGIALRDVLKTATRAALKDQPAYAHYSDIKQTIRKEQEPATYVAILPPGQK